MSRHEDEDEPGGTTGHPAGPLRVPPRARTDGDRQCSPDLRDFARRTLAVTVAATVVACGIVALIERAVLTVVAVLICVVAHPLLAASVATWVRHRAGRWDPVTARWAFAGLTTACSLAVLVALSGAVALTAALAEPGPGPTGAADTFFGLTFALVVGVCLSGLPLWTFLAAVLIGPGGDAAPSTTARHPRRRPHLKTGRP